ncbi:MAG: aspartate-semialdehyde dehydrogenase [Nitrososphaerales archaeon]
MGKIPIAIIGATGIVGQQFMVALQNHPWFEIYRLVASERSAGKNYREALYHDGIFGWYCDEGLKEELLEMRVISMDEFKPRDVKIVFTALDSSEAKVIEPKLAEKIPVISTASSFRYFDDIPILIPGVNNEHVELIRVQREKRGWEGFITPIPNCTTTGLAITLKPLDETFGLEKVLMTSLQAVSGAGRTSGVLALDILDNVIPYIPREEEKVQRETKKILGRFTGNSIEFSDVQVSCTCIRVNVRDGHTESVFVSMKKEADVEEAKQAFRTFGKSLRELNLPSAPKEMIVVHEDPSRPQPRLDRDTYDGMATIVGRVRKDEALPNGLKYVLLSHNTKMGAAKGAVLVAELLSKFGFIEGF